MDAQSAVQGLFYVVGALLFVAAFVLLTYLRGLVNGHGNFLDRFLNQGEYAPRGKRVVLRHYARSFWNRPWFFGAVNYEHALRHLPRDLVELDIGSCDVEEVPELPCQKLQVLRAHNCPRLRRIRTWPDSIDLLHIWECPLLAEIPEQLPQSAKIVRLVGTSLQAIPTCPPAVEEFDARCNEQLMQVPSQWPDTLRWLNLCNTPARATVHSLPAQLSLEELRKHGGSGHRVNNLFGWTERADGTHFPQNPQFIIG